MPRLGDDERRGGERQPRDSLPTGHRSGPSLAITSSALSRHHGPQRSAESNVGCAGRSASFRLVRQQPSPRDAHGRALLPDCLIARRQYVRARLAVATKCNIRHRPDTTVTATASICVCTDLAHADGSSVYGSRAETARCRLGGYQLVSLAEAREKAFINRKIARSGGDPRTERHKVRDMPHVRRGGCPCSGTEAGGLAHRQACAGLGLQPARLQRSHSWAIDRLTR